MWSNLRKRGFLSVRFHKFRSYSVWHGNDKLQTYDYKFTEFKEKLDRHSLIGMLESIFRENPINVNNTYVMKQFLDSISKVPVKHHSCVQEYLEKLNEDESTNALKLNVKLQLLLGSPEINHAEVYEFIVNNLNYKLENGLIELFIYDLVKDENISAATTLLHIVFEKTPSFILSNELWSLYISKTCELGHYLGSCLIYHELIDNYEEHSKEKSGINYQNNHIPFLVANTCLERLALIFQHNSDPMRINGLLNYFKRFYSYAGHSETYKSLKCSLVEAYSNKGNLGAALEQFRNLAFILKGHRNYSKKDNTAIPKMSAFNHFRWRRDNIKSNNYDTNFDAPDNMKTNLDFVEEETAQLKHMKLFRPNEERNVYTFPGHSYTPIVDGSIKINDLPYFHALLRANIKHLMSNSGPERIDSLTNYISDCHFMLHIFINACLCELGYVREAFLLLLLLPKLYPKVFLNVLIREEDFIHLFKACKYNFDLIEDNAEYNHYNEAEELYKLVHDIKSFQENINQKTNTEVTSLRLNEIFISTLLSYQAITFEKLKIYLDEILRLSSRQNLNTFRLSIKETEKLKALCSTKDSKYSSHFGTWD